MTKKHFEAVAAAIAEQREIYAVGLDASFREKEISSEVNDALDHLSESLAEVFKADNPRFVTHRFLKATGTRN